MISPRAEILRLIRNSSTTALAMVAAVAPPRPLTTPPALHRRPRRTRKLRHHHRPLARVHVELPHVVAHVSAKHREQTPARVWRKRCPLLDAERPPAASATCDQTPVARVNFHRSLVSPLSGSYPPNMNRSPRSTTAAWPVRGEHRRVRVGVERPDPALVQPRPLLLRHFVLPNVVQRARGGQAAEKHGGIGVHAGLKAGRDGCGQRVPKQETVACSFRDDAERSERGCWGAYPGCKRTSDWPERWLGWVPNRPSTSDVALELTST